MLVIQQCLKVLEINILTLVALILVDVKIYYIFFSYYTSKKFTKQYEAI